MEERKLQLSRKDKKIAGVCGGIAEYFRLDPTLVRIAFALVTVLGYGITILIYIILWAVMPLDRSDLL